MSSHPRKDFLSFALPKPLEPYLLQYYLYKYSLIQASFFAAYNFTGIGPHYLALCGYKAGSGWINEETVLWGTWNDDFSVITFEDAPLIGERLYTYPAGDPTGYRYGLYKIIKMTR